MTSSHSTFGPLVVFGGASGIGLATATLGGEQHDAVVIADVSPQGHELPIVTSGRARYERCDAADPAGVLAVLQGVIARHGRLGAVVTTVGGAHLQDPLKVDLDAWRKEISFNLDSAYVVATTAAQLMVANGGGAIVTSSSTYAHLARPDRIGYTAAKAGVIALTKSLAAAVAHQHVRVNCVAPGSTDTPRLRAMSENDAAFQAKVQALPQQRMCTPQDLARTILFLASPAAQSTTGQVLWVNNGAFMP